MKKVKRLEPRVYQNIEYVLWKDIVKFHCKKWSNKYNKAAGPANTCIVVPANDPSHWLPTEQIGIYYHDYKRFADVVDYNNPTYWD
jgi:hypothetical protein